MHVLLAIAIALPRLVVLTSENGILLRQFNFLNWVSKNEIFQILPHRYIKRAIADFMITTYDENGVEKSYQMKPSIDLLSHMGYLSGDGHKGT